MESDVIEGCLGAKEEMTAAVAVRGAESVDCRCGVLRHRLSQVALLPFRCPDGQRGDIVGYLPQVVDMPVLALAPPQVSFDAFGQVGHGRADIDIETCRKMMFTKLTDRDRLRLP